MTVSSNQIENQPTFTIHSFFQAILAQDITSIHAHLDAGISPNSLNTDQAGHPALHVAIAVNNPAIVQALLTRGANVDVRQEDGSTSLIFAIQSIGAIDVLTEIPPARLTIIDVLLNNHANVNAINQNGNSAIVYARQSLVLIRKLIARGANTSLSELTLFFSELKKENIPERREIHLRIIDALLTSDVDVNAFDELGDTAVHKVVKYENCDPQIITKLARKNANLNAINRSGDTALELAIELGRLEMVAVLLDNGADANIVTSSGYTSLILAMIKVEGEEDVIKRAVRLTIVDKLLAFNLDINAVRNNGDTALHSAVRYGNCNHELIAKLARKNANLNAINRDGATALEVAILYGCLEKVATLLENGANANLPMIIGEGETSLMLAIRKVSGEDDPAKRALALSLIDKLLASNFDRVDAVCGKDNEAALHLAVKCHINEAIPKLAMKHANMDVQTPKGETPLDYALNTGNLPAVKSLVTNGASATSQNMMDAMMFAVFGEGDTKRKFQVIFELLLESKANPLTPTRYHKLLEPLSLAKNYKNKFKSRMLVTYIENLMHALLTSQMQVYFCPLSRRPIKDPVTLSTGITYDREPLIRHQAILILESGLSQIFRCPVTRLEIDLSEVNAPTNIKIKQAIEKSLTALEKRPTPPTLFKPLPSPKTIKTPMAERLFKNLL